MCLIFRPIFRTLNIDRDINLNIDTRWHDGNSRLAKYIYSFQRVCIIYA